MSFPLLLNPFWEGRWHKQLMVVKMQTHCGCLCSFPSKSWYLDCSWALSWHYLSEHKDFFAGSYKGKAHHCTCWPSCLLQELCQTPSLGPAHPLAHLGQWGWEYGCFWRLDLPLDLWGRSLDSHAVVGSFPWSDLKGGNYRSRLVLWQPLKWRGHKAHSDTVSWNHQVPCSARVMPGTFSQPRNVFIWW